MAFCSRFRCRSYSPARVFALASRKHRRKVRCFFTLFLFYFDIYAGAFALFCARTRPTSITASSVPWSAWGGIATQLSVALGRPKRAKRYICDRVKENDRFQMPFFHPLRRNNGGCLVWGAGRGKTKWILSIFQHPISQPSDRVGVYLSVCM